MHNIIKIILHIPLLIVAVITTWLSYKLFLALFVTIVSSTPANYSFTESKEHIDEPASISTRAFIPETTKVYITEADVVKIINKTYKYPVFKLDMKGSYTDFELKATTNNFESMVYFYTSTGVHPHGGYDPNPKLYYADDTAQDIRKWVLAINGVSVYDQLPNKNTWTECIYFMPSRETVDINSVINSADSWMWQNNPNLIWSWVRIDGTNPEQNPITDRQHWNPIRPDSWEIQRLQLD